MMSALNAKVGIGIFVALFCGGAGFFVLHHASSPSAVSTSPTYVLSLIKPADVHTANWYVTHPNVLKQDERRCAGDAATISRASCQNADSADEQLTQIEMQNAATENGASGTAGTPPIKTSQ